MRVALTTIVRFSKLDEPSGWLRVVDLDSGEDVGRAPTPDALHRAHDPNARGGLRGARGLAACGDRLVMAPSDRLLILDRQWAPRASSAIVGSAAATTSPPITAASGDVGRQ